MLFERPRVLMAVVGLRVLVYILEVVTESGDFDDKIAGAQAT